MHETLIIKNAEKLKIPNFLGVFPIDKLPIPKYSNFSFILNHDVAAGPGTHWVAVLLTKDGKAEYYDSLALSVPPELYEWKKNISFNRKPTQNMFADTCGEHALYYLYLRLVVGLNQAEVLKLLYKKENADNYVRKFINNFS